MCAGFNYSECTWDSGAAAAMAERLSRLEAVEADILRLMQNARETCEELQKMHEGDRSRLVGLSREYLELVERVHAGMMEHVHLVQPYSQYHRSNNALQLEVEVLEAAKATLDHRHPEHQA